MNTKTSDWYRIPIKQNNKGFTIIELLVVIAIIALISSVVLVSMRGSTGKAKIAKSLEFSQTILNVIGVDAVGVWSFDEGTGDYAYDKSGYGNHGTLVGKPDWVDGEENTPHWYVNEGEGRSALSFDGSGDYVNCGKANSLNITDAITVEAWAKSDGFKNGGGIVSKGSWSNQGYFISYAYSPHCVYFGVRDNTGYHPVSTGLCEQFDWAHIVGVKKDNKLEVYVNGKKKEEWSGTLNSISNPNLVLTIGKSSNGYYFDGLIDEVRIYASALSSAEIQQHYAESAPRHQLVINNQ